MRFTHIILVTNPMLVYMKTKPNVGIHENKLIGLYFNSMLSYITVQHHNLTILASKCTTHSIDLNNCVKSQQKVCFNSEMFSISETVIKQSFQIQSKLFCSGGKQL